MKYLILLILLSCVSLLSATGQFTMNIASNDDDGLVTRFSSYLLADSGDWTFLNTTKVKYSEHQTNISDYYQESYVRNILQGIMTKKNVSVSFNMGLGISPSDNHYLLPEGTDKLLEAENSYTLGGGFTFDNDKTYFEVDFDFYGGEYEQYNLGLTHSEKISESDMFASAKAGLWLSSDLLVYVKAKQFDDLNESDLMNYAEYDLTFQLQKKMNYIHHLEQDISFGYSDIDEDLPYYVNTRTRLSSRFTPDWTLLNVVEYRGWLDEDKEHYLGNSWAKTIIRRNLGISAENEISYLQTAAEYDIDTEIGFSQFAARAVWSMLIFSGSGNYYFGDDLWLKHKINAGITWQFTALDMNLGYEIELTKDSASDSSSLHALFLEYKF